MRSSIIVSLLLMSFHCFGQRIGRLAEVSLDANLPFTIRAMGTEDGIPQNQVAVLTTDEHNNLIVGTANGYARFNGQRFTPVSSNERVKWVIPREIHYDKKNKRINCLNHLKNEYEISPELKSLSNELFVAATFYSNHTYGISKNGTIYKGKIGTGIYHEFLRVPKGEKNFIYIGFAAGKMFVTNGNGTFILTKNGWRKISDDLIIRAKKNPYSSDVFLLGIKNVYTLRNGKLEIYALSLPANDYFFSDIAFSSHGEIFIASRKGLVYIADDYTDFFTCNQGMPSETLIALEYIAEENILFIGTSDRGLLLLKTKECASFYNATDLQQASLSSIVKTPDGAVIISGSSHHVYALNWNRFIPYFSARSQFSTVSIVNKQVWIGSWGDGIFIVENKKLVDSIPAKLLPDGKIHGIFQDNKKRIWIGTSNGVALIGEDKSIIHLLPKKIKGVIICFKQLRNGDILIGSEQGVQCVSNDLTYKYHLSEKSSGLVAKEVRAFHELTNGDLLIGTYGGGLYYLRKSNQELIAVNRMENCLLDIDVFTLAPDLKGNLYATSNHGLYIINESDIVSFVHGTKNYLIPFKLGQNDGILNTEFNGGFQNNYYRNSLGHFYFPGIQGVVVSYFELPKKRKLKPQLDEIFVNDKSISKKQHVFDRKTHTVKFKFHCTNYTSFYNLNYQYKLIGPNINQDWSSFSEEGEVSFKMLPPGKYRLYVRGIDGFNDSNPEVIYYYFQIEHYFFETIWFKLFAISFLFLLIFLIIYRRILYLKKKEIKENEIQLNLTELKLSAIQSKMNPHFIFNCLNNIQNLIVLGKSDEAQQAMSDFSGLLRSFLQQSENTFVQLCEEQQLLKAYLAVEKYRFEDDLKAIFDIPTNLSFYYIPTLLIQPTVENAILHGLNHKKGDKYIRIEATVKSNNLIIIIEDNGIGREASRKINKNRKGHISHGSKIISDKIELLKERYGYSINFEIIDKPNQGGTIVKFTFPLIATLDNKN